MGKISFVQGNEAIVMGAIDGGARFYAGYPITPSSEIAELASLRLPACDGIYVQMEDEISSMAAIIGASLSGMKAFTATSGPGFSLMQENLGVGLMGEVPCVIVNIQRSGPSTGMATKPAQGDVMQARWGTHGDHGIIVLCPSSVQECYELTIEAFNLSEAFRIPVVLLGDEIIGHLKEKLEVMEPEEIKIINRKQPTGPLSEYKPYDHQNGIAPLANYGGDYLLRVTGSMHDAKGHANNNPQMAENYIRHLSDKVETNKETIVITKKHGLEDAECVIVGYGCTARSALAAMETGRKRGLKIGVLQLVTLWPFPEKEVQEVLSQAKQIIVPELNLGQVVSEVKKLNQWQTQIVAVNRVDGKNIHPDEILSAIGEARHV